MLNANAEVVDFVQKEVRGEADSRVWTEEEQKLARKGSDILAEARWAHLKSQPSQTAVSLRQHLISDYPRGALGEGRVASVNVKHYTYSFAPTTTAM